MASWTQPLRRGAGVMLAAGAVAAAAWAPSVNLPQPPVSPQPPDGQQAAAEPRVVEVARQALREGLPARVEINGTLFRVERLPGGRAIVCEHARSCALAARGAERILVVAGEEARRKLRRAAREGEPR